MTDTTTPATASDLFKSQILSISRRIVHFSQSSAGTADGSSEANALPIAAFDAFVGRPGDVLALHGTITTPLIVGPNHNGDSSASLSIVGNIGTPAVLNGGTSDTPITLAPFDNLNYITIRNIEITSGLYGIYGFAHKYGLNNILIKDIHVKAAIRSGIHFDTGAVTTSDPYAECRNVVVDNCTVDTAGYFGIAMALNCDNSCGIMRSTVKAASTSGGSFWGIYVSGFPRVKTTPSWSGSNPYTIDLTGLGWTSGEAPHQTIKQFLIRDYTTASTSNKLHFTKGTYGSLSDWQFGQSGTTIQIKLPSADASIGTYTVLSSPILQDGGFVEDCEASNCVGVDGVGIGADNTAAGWRIERCYSHGNSGRGIELSLSRGCRIIDCKSLNSGSWDFNMFNLGGDLSEILFNKGTGATSNSFYVQRCETNMVSLRANEARKAGEYDYKLSDTASVLSSGNLSFGCISHNASLCDQFT